MKKHLLVALSVLCLCSCFEEKKVENDKEDIVAKQETKPKKEYKKEPRDYRDGYSSLEGFKFGTSYEEAKRIVEKEVGEIWFEEEEDLLLWDKNFDVFFGNTIDSIDIGGIEFYFKNNKLYGIKADVYFLKDTENYLTEELGRPYNLDGKRIWIISKGNETYYLSLYNEIINAEIYDEELDISEQDVIEFIKIK